MTIYTLLFMSRKNFCKACENFIATIYFSLQTSPKIYVVLFFFFRYLVISILTLKTSHCRQKFIYRPLIVQWLLWDSSTGCSQKIDAKVYKFWNVWILLLNINELFTIQVPTILHRNGLHVQSKVISHCLWEL